MRQIAIIAVAALMCGCILDEGKAEVRYVCPEGQVVGSPAECPQPTTSTTSTTEPTTTTSTTTTTTSTTTTYVWPTVTTTTLCDDSKFGYVIVTDQEVSCYRGYTFKINPSKTNYGNVGISGGNTIGFFAQTPGGELNEVQAILQSNGGFGFEYKDTSAMVMCVTTDAASDERNTHYAAMMKFS
jgi:hypothetical protein